MSESHKFPLKEADIRTLANAAGLNLEKGREGTVHAILTLWLKDAHELNRKMRQRKHWGITPMTVFTHPRR